MPEIHTSHQFQERRGLKDGLEIAPPRDPTWCLVEEGFNLAREHEVESLFAVGNGYIGTRGSLAEGSSLSAPATFIAGIYDGAVDGPAGAAHPGAGVAIPATGARGGRGMARGPASIPELAVGPAWMRLSATVDGEPLALEHGEALRHRRILDLRNGLLWREWRHRSPGGRITHVRGFRLASLADRHVLYQSVAITPENYSGPLMLELYVEAPALTGGRVPGARYALEPVAVGQGDPPIRPSLLTLRTQNGRYVVGLAAASELHAPTGGVPARDTASAPGRLTERWELDLILGETYRLDRFVTVYTSRDVDRPTEAAADHLRTLLARGARRLLEDHVRAWHARWHAADVEVDGDDDAQRALRFACYHLISAANPEDEHVSIGARALTGPAYGGHVFWDTEIYMLPFFIHTHPPTARTLLLYRWHTLPAAREKARALGYRGAFYPWESAADGRDATPRLVLAPDGTVVEIRNGEQETHISADVAYGVWRYWQATGDDAFLRDAGAEILFETARFWASRGRLEVDGRFHIRHVIGPDEYHEDVDDDAYTNGMASWNLEHAARAARILAWRWPDAWTTLRERLDLTDDEIREWTRLADAVHLGMDPETGLIEQFAGYFELEDIDLATYEPRMAPMDMILGRERIRRSQIIKQPDVLMLIYLLWDRFPPEVREANFDYYDRRTGHGSSLSPSVHALLGARLGRMELALRYFRQAAEIDLADNMGNAAYGVHAAALGGLWQAAVLGFGGMVPGADEPRFEPSLPAGWHALRFPVQWRGRTLRVAADAAGRLEVVPEESALPPE